ncbi:Alanine aminotransferase 1 [Eumeta japonica]|uniref:alanine transaminase n=1 Tax=Eumeta variegata TaxID=151549 RepID=A0A4C1T5Y6_EUMVA|nr:Alanine aminotransferase 1 [Eumeta japonica]
MKVGHERAVTADTVNQRLRRVNYAVRGPLLARAERLEDALKKAPRSDQGKAAAVLPSLPPKPGTITAGGDARAGAEVARAREVAGVVINDRVLVNLRRTLIWTSLDYSEGVTYAIKRKTRVNPLADHSAEGALTSRCTQLGPATRYIGENHFPHSQGEKLPFDRVVRANVGDCHALGQPPITFLRQLLALVACPDLLLASPPPAPADVAERARRLLRDCMGKEQKTLQRICASVQRGGIREEHPRTFTNNISGPVFKASSSAADVWICLRSPPHTWETRLFLLRQLIILIAGQPVTTSIHQVISLSRRGSVGAYSPSSGLAAVRDSVAAYIQRRDGAPAEPEHVYLGSGATDLIRAVLALLAQSVDGKSPGVMIPIPQYPVFSGALAELGIDAIPYYLDEDRNWALDVAELERAYEDASKNRAVRALVVINPGNPTGQVLSRDSVEEVVRFAHSKRLFLLADEVYQENIINKQFHSFKKVAYELGRPYSDVELASFFTCSKGWAVECGLRAGYVELIGLEPAVRNAFESSRALGQCPGVLGQCLLECAVNPPRPGDASYKLFMAERQRLQEKLKASSAAVRSALSSIPGYICNPIEASMFAFPRLEIPISAVAEAGRRGLQPDEFYFLCLLEETGVFVVPGSGFGQRPGTYHFRTTILHDQEELEHILNSFSDFHCKFLKRYS